MGLRSALRDGFDRRRESVVCRAAVELMTAYLDGAMDASLRRRFEAHLADCPACNGYLEQMRATVAVLGRLETDRVDPDVRAELVSIYRAFRVR
jgi:anti-sigma factor RsiW